MNFLDDLKQRMGLQPPPRYPNRPEPNTLRETIEAGQRYKRAEHFQAAQDALSSAMQLAVSSGDGSAMAVITLTQAEVYSALGRYDEAQELLEKAYQGAQENRQRTQMAYLLATMGYVEQRRGDWKAAQNHLEQAVNTARINRIMGAEGRALGLMADNYLHDKNASYAIHLLKDALPKLNAAGEIELSGYFVGRLGEALIMSGQESEGQQLIERALRLSRQIGYRQYERQWNITLGKRALEAGLFENALQYFGDAIALFENVSDRRELVECLGLASKASLQLQDSDTAIDYARRAKETAEQLGDGELALRSELTLGITLAHGKMYEEALPYLEKSAQMGGVQPIGYSETEVNRSLAAIRVEMGNHEAATETYRQAIQRAEQAGHPLEVAQAMRDLGLFFVGQHKTGDAIHEWARALAIYESEHQYSQAARLYCDLAAARKFIGQGQRAIKDYEQALMLLSNLQDDWETRGLVLSNAATAYAEQGDLESADSFFNEALAIARRLNNEFAEATRRGNYGWFLMATGRPQQALSTLEYALRMSQKLGLGLQSAIQTDNMGLAYDSMGNYEKGLELHQSAEALMEGIDNPHWLHIIRANRANSLLGMKMKNEAKALFEAALEQGRKSEDVELVIRGLTGMTRIALVEGEADRCGGWLEEASGLARRADMRRLQAEALAVHSEQQAAIQAYEQAERLWQEAKKLFTILNSPQASIEPMWLKKA